MAADEIQAYQDEVLNRLAVALTKVHGIAFFIADMQQGDAASFVTELLETASIPPGRDGHEIAFLIGAWIELDIFRDP